MSPIIILDKKQKTNIDNRFTGGKAIISYVFRVLIDIFYNNLRIYQSIQNPNYIKINGKIYFEDKN